MSIKDKPLKKCHSDKRVTIDTIHNNTIRYNYTQYPSFDY